MARKKTINSPPGKDDKSATPNKWWVRGTSETSEFFGVSAQTLSDWEKRGAPKEGYGKWDIKKLIDWKQGDGSKSPEVRKLTAEADWKEAKAAQEAIKLAVAEGRYIATVDITADLKRLFAALKRSLLAIGHDIATELNTFDPDAALAAKRVVEDAMQNALKQLTETGEYMQKRK